MSYTNIAKSIKTQDTLKTIDFKDAAKNIQQLLKRISQGDNQYIIKSNGQNIAVLLSYNDYQNFIDTGERREQAKHKVLEFIRELREHNKDVNPEEIQADIDQAVREVKKAELEELQLQAQ